MTPAQHSEVPASWVSALAEALSVAVDEPEAAAGTWRPRPGSPLPNAATPTPAAEARASACGRSTVEA